MSGAMTPGFQRAVALVLTHEGGYGNDPRDPGGETKFGISKRSYPHEDIARLTRERAVEIYHRDFWTPIRGDELPWPMAVQVFDHAVNAGTGPAIRLLQRTLGVEDDGIVGPATLLKAADAAERAHLIEYARRRIRYYTGLARWPVFGDSWTQRTLDTLVQAVLQ